MTVTPWNAADYLNTQEDIALYLDEMLKIAREDNAPELFIQALGDVTRSKGMSEAAREIEVSRESLYKSLGVSFTMKGIAEAAGSTMRLALLVPFGAVVVRGTATAFLACGWHAVCIRQKIR